MSKATHKIPGPVKGETLCGFKIKTNHRTLYDTFAEALDTNKNWVEVDCKNCLREGRKQRHPKQ